MTANENDPARRERGMTLIEIMVVITILGLIAGAVAVNVIGSLTDAKIKQAKTDLHTLENCLELYKMDRGRYPTTEEGLQALVTAGKCKAQLKDPWKNDYAYMCPGQIHPESFDIKSYGADGQPGGEGENADIVNQ
ncbi:MAG TPA: type II secretion system major pseudopilin GspG [Anaeromyxobacteraceae bacterium]|nr:type II secretion system major pseudopilin GspG [Anaeromyxobacteraceae bacterium]